MSTETDSDGRERIVANISGEPAKILRELRRRGLVASNADAIRQGLLALWEKVITRDAAEARLRAIGGEEA